MKMESITFTKRAMNLVAKGKLKEAINILAMNVGQNINEIGDDLLLVSSLLHNFEYREAMNLSNSNTREDVTLAIIRLIRRIENIKSIILDSTNDLFDEIEFSESSAVEKIFSEKDYDRKGELTLMFMYLFENTLFVEDHEKELDTAKTIEQVGLALLKISYCVFFNKFNPKKETIELVYKSVFNKNDTISYLSIYTLYVLCNYSSIFPGILKLESKQQNELTRLLCFGEKDNYSKSRLIHILSKSSKDYSCVFPFPKYLSKIINNNADFRVVEENLEINHSLNNIFYLFLDDKSQNLRKAASLALGRGRYDSKLLSSHYLGIIHDLKSTKNEKMEALIYLSKSRYKIQWADLIYLLDEQDMQLEFLCCLLNAEDFDTLYKIITNHKIALKFKVGAIVFIFNNSALDWAKIKEKNEALLFEILQAYFNEPVNLKSNSAEVSRKVFNDLNAQIELENALIYDIRFPPQEGEHSKSWFVIDVDRNKQQAFECSIKTPRMLDLNDYGTILYSGWGNGPNETIKKDLNARYGMYRNDV